MNELLPESLYLTAEAHSHWISFHGEIECEMKVGGQYFFIQGFASKIAINVLRIAGVLWAFNRGRELEVSGHSDLPEAYIKNAISIARFYLSEALRIHASSQIDLKLYEAQILLDWIRQKNLKTLPTTYIYQFG